MKTGTLASFFFPTYRPCAEFWTEVGASWLTIGCVLVCGSTWVPLERQMLDTGETVMNRILGRLRLVSARVTLARPADEPALLEGLSWDRSTVMSSHPVRLPGPFFGLHDPGTRQYAP